MSTKRVLLTGQAKWCRECLGSGRVQAEVAPDDLIALIKRDLRRECK